MTWRPATRWCGGSKWRASFIAALKPTCGSGARAGSKDTCHFDHFSPDFRNTDLGFHTFRVDKTDANGVLFLRQPDPWGLFRRVQVGVGGGRIWNTDGLELERFVGVSANTQFRNFWNVNFFIGHNFRAFDDLDTRGGPPIVNPAETFLNVFVGSDSRKTWALNLGLNGARDEEGGWNARLGPFVRLQPSARLQVSVGTNYAFGQEVAQWITNEDVTGDGDTDYVYRRLRRDVIDVTGRATYAFHRDMTLEVFLQPFVAVGDYTDIRRLARPLSFEFEPATIPFNPDFNRKSLRGNIVLRWDVRPRQHAVFCLEHVDHRRDTTWCLRPGGGPRQHVRRRGYPRLHGQAELLARALGGRAALP